MRGGGGHPPFKPGEKPPAGAGRPAGVRSWSTVAREMFERGELNQEQIVKALARRCKQGNTKAIEIIFNRMDGNPLQSVRVEGELKTIQEMSEVDLLESIKRDQEEIAKLDSGEKA
jgi:hypothetical protein